jgi:hypothetical protein
MARQRLIDDKASQICWKYLHGEYDEKTNVAIHNIAHHNTEKIIAITMIFDIAHRIGYAHSDLAQCMGETTYKIKKKRIRDKLVSEVN